MDAMWKMLQRSNAIDGSGVLWLHAKRGNTELCKKLTTTREADGNLFVGKDYCLEL